MLPYILKAVRSARDFLFYLRLRAHIRRDWRARHRLVMQQPHIRNFRLPRASRQAHTRRWSVIDKHPRIHTLQACAAISGNADPDIVPEEIFAADLERLLNRTEWASVFSHKSFYNRVFTGGYFAECLLHCIDGIYFDATGRRLSGHAVLDLTQQWVYPIVFKPNTGSSGGFGVRFPESPQELAAEMSKSRSFVVQPLLRQHPFLSAFNQKGLNTLRVYTYRSLESGEPHILNCALRMGKGGSLDNETSGGIVTYVNPDGCLNNFAVDKYGGRYDTHPDTGIRFSGSLVLPEFGRLRTLALYLADQLPLTLAGWDFSLGENAAWICIEVNLAGHTTRFSQYAGHPFFGPFTSEVIDFCRAHPRRRRANVRVS